MNFYLFSCLITGRSFIEYFILFKLLKLISKNVHKTCLALFSVDDFEPSRTLAVSVLLTECHLHLSKKKESNLEKKYYDPNIL